MSILFFSEFFLFFFSMYFFRTCFFVLIVLACYFVFTIQHTPQTSIPPVGFEPAGSDRLQTLSVDRSATGRVESATNRLVAQCLDHLHYCVSLVLVSSLYKPDSRFLLIQELNPDTAHFSQTSLLSTNVSIFWILRECWRRHWNV